MRSARARPKNGVEHGNFSFVELAETYSKQAHLTSAWQRIIGRPPPPTSRHVARAEPRSIARRLSPQQVDAIMLGYQSGRDSPDLALEFGVSAPSVLRLLHKHGVPTRRQHSSR